jgi:hypothetical protein
MISPNSQAIILLTAYFNKNDKPLTISEYSQFAIWLLENNFQPSDLLNDNKILKLWNHAKISQERILSLLSRGNAMSIAMQKWQDCGIWVLTRADEAYPLKFKKILKYKSPPIIYGCGSQKLLKTKGIAIIGSRDASKENLDFAFSLGKDVALSGYSVISGGAKGIDESAMFGSIDTNGTTIGVVADTLMQKSLSKKYRDAIITENLTLISPFYPEAKFNVGNAMNRNKYIYILSSASVVVHSGLKGGTWEGAKENLQNGWSRLFVKPNLDENSGNTQLLQMGGAEFYNIGDIFKQKQDKVDINLKHEILNLLSKDKFSIDEIMQNLNRPQKQIKIEIKNLIASEDIQKHKTKPIKFSKIQKLF